jgi:hypothetical protein
VITKHSRFHRAVASAAALMTVAGGIAEALPLSADAQTFSYPQPTGPQTAPAYPYLQQQPTAQGAYPYGYSYPYYPQPAGPQTAPGYPYQLHQQQPTARGTTDQLNREELGRLQSDNGHSPYSWPSDSPSGWGWGPPWGWGWGSPWGWGWPVGVSVGFGGCFNCGFHRAFFHPGFRHFGFGHPGFFRPGFFRPGFFRPGLGRFGFAHAGFFHPGFGRFGFSHAGFGRGSHGGGRR